MVSNRHVPVRIESIQKTHCQAGFALVIRPLNMPPKAPPPVIINLWNRKHMDGVLRPSEIQNVHVKSYFSASFMKKVNVGHLWKAVKTGSPVG